MSVCGINACTINAASVNGCCILVIIGSGVGQTMIPLPEDRTMEIEASPSEMTILAESTGMSIPVNTNSMVVAK